MNFILSRKLSPEDLKYWSNSYTVAELESNILEIFCVSVRKLIWHNFCLQKILLYQESVHMQIVIEQNIVSGETDRNSLYIWRNDSEISYPSMN